MGDTNNHIFQINVLLKNIKSILHAEFICPYPRGVSIITNSVPNPSDLIMMSSTSNLLKVLIIAESLPLVFLSYDRK